MRFLRACLSVAGALLILLPALSFLREPSMAAQRRERAAIAKWPGVTGTLDEVRLQRTWRAGRGRRWYCAEVRYRYTLDGRDFLGERIGLQPVKATSEQELAERVQRLVAETNLVAREAGFKGAAESGSDQGEPRTVWRLQNQPVVVYYDPGRPEISLLDRNDYAPPSLLTEAAPLVACTLLGLTILTVSVLARRTLPSALGRS